jgi:hypothetical protein
MEEIWIVGVGHFGQMAFRRLSEERKDRYFVLVDPVAENLQNFKSPQARLEVADGIVYVEKHLMHSGGPDWIIPALPLHLAAEWLILHLGPNRLRRIELPFELDRLVANSFRGFEGNLYVSYAGFRCPEDCDEPREFCIITREVRKQNMFEMLGNLNIKPFKAINLRSHQLGPGIGGYRAEQLVELRKKVELATGPVLLSTACRCHGVITGLEPL